MKLYIYTPKKSEYLRTELAIPESHQSQNSTTEFVWAFRFTLMVQNIETSLRRGTSEICEMAGMKYEHNITILFFSTGSTTSRLLLTTGLAYTNPKRGYETMEEMVGIVHTRVKLFKINIGHILWKKLNSRWVMMYRLCSNENVCLWHIVICSFSLLSKLKQP